MVLLSGGLGLYFLGSGLWDVFRHPDHGWGVAICLMVVILIFSALPLAVAYLAYRREWRRVAKIGGGLGTLAVFVAVNTCLRPIGLERFVLREPGEVPWMSAIRCVAAIVCGLGPFYAAAWFARWCGRVIDRRLPAPPIPERAPWWVRRSPHQVETQRVILKARLVVGSLMVAGPVLAFLGALGWMLAATYRPELAESWNGTGWGVDPFGVGFLVMAAGVGVFLVGMIIRGGAREALRELPPSGGWPTMPPEPVGGR